VLCAFLKKTYKNILGYNIGNERIIRATLTEAQNGLRGSFELMVVNASNGSPKTVKD
jgi:hypothetical protein